MSKEINNAHDKYFAYTMSLDMVAKDFLKTFLPSKIVKLVDIDNGLKLVSNSFIDKDLKGHFTDIVFHCKVKGSDVAIIIALVLEHKSYPEPEAIFQLLRYVQNAWDNDLKQGGKRKFVLPLLLYHGSEKWKKKEINEFFPIKDKHLTKFIPKFDYLLIDFSHYSNDEVLNLKASAMVINFVMALKQGRNKNFGVKQIQQIFYRYDEYTDKETGKNFLHATFVYLMSVTAIADSKWNQIIEELPKPIKKTAMTLYDSILLKGEAKGEAKGRAKGREEGQQLLLIIAKKLKAGESVLDITKELNVALDLVLKVKAEFGF